jgi:ATP-dependent 26S proteasome regulatory subunit
MFPCCEERKEEEEEKEEEEKEEEEEEEEDVEKEKEKRDRESILYIRSAPLFQGRVVHHIQQARVV